MDADNSFRSLFMFSLRGALGEKFSVNDLQGDDTPALLRKDTHTHKHTLVHHSGCPYSLQLVNPLVLRSWERGAFYFEGVWRVSGNCRLNGIIDRRV